jgi:four helix bundle protein
MNNYKELIVWQKAVDLSFNVYKILENFPNDERFGIISQIKRCAVSVPSNIAEGAGRNTDKEFNHFLGIALGSSFELETQLIIANKLEYLDTKVCNNTLDQVTEIQKMIYSLKKSIFNKI